MTCLEKESKTQEKVARKNSINSNDIDDTKKRR